MALIPVPPRRYGTELLDDPSLDAALVVRTLQDITRSNSLFQGAGAAVRELARHIPTLENGALLLDVGTGLGDLPRKAQQQARRAGLTLRTLGVDTGLPLLRSAREHLTYVVCANGLTLPFADASVDLVLCSQTLHHFRGDEARTLLRELERVARVAVVVSDLRRSWAAIAGFWAASFPLGFHQVTRRDGVVSILRGFTARELGDTVEDAVGVRPTVRRHIGFRLTATWTPRRASHEARESWSA